jgi:hypothetical protein
VRPFEDVMVEQLAELVRAGVPIRGVRLTVRELFVARIERGPLGPREVSEAVESMVRAACRLVQDLDAPDELVETVCRATLEAVRGHGGETARWFPEATSAAYVVLDELATGSGGNARWRWIARHLSQWA